MKKVLPLLLVLFYMSTFAQQKAAFTGNYPATKIVTQTDDFFGTKVADPYRWLENDTAADTKAWVQEQNRITQAYLNKIPFRDKIKNRLTQLWNYERFSAPFTEGAFTYFYKNNGLQNQAVLYRQTEAGTPEVFLDPNTFSTDGTIALSGIEFTHDGSLAAYTISIGGSDWNKLMVINTATKQLLNDTLEVKFSGIAWAGNQGFYYSTYDKPADGSILSGLTNQHKLMYHQLGTKQSDDVLIFGGTLTPRRYIGAYVTENQEWLVITAAEATYGNELYIKSLVKKDAPIIPIVTGYATEPYVVYANQDLLYIFTNENAPNKKLVIAPAATPTPNHWKELIAQTAFPLSVTTCGGKLFAQYLKEAVSLVIQYNLDGTKEKEIPLPGLGTASGFSGKKTEHQLYYSFTSYIYPPTIFSYDIAKAASVVYKKSNVQFNAADYESRQVMYPSADGTKIPMIITCKKGTVLNGKNPTQLYGYGGFGVSLTPAFSVSNLVFMENGGVYAVANLRGGGEYGDAWHIAGTKMQKQNVFSDFIAAAEYLIKEQYTSPAYLAISGGSNGGLLVGACMTQRPELFRVCLPAVGVMDMLRYHKFTAGAGWAYDYGTADDSKEMFEYLYKYSPVQNLRSGTCYPATMVTTADHDDRVVPAHSFKFAAGLQAAQSCNNATLIRIESNAGHGAGKPTSKTIEEITDKLSFIFWNMGIDYNH